MNEPDQTKTPLTEALKRFWERRPVYFCIPGHRFEYGIPEDLKAACGGNILNFDLTEAPGLDDLHNAKGAVKEAQELLAAAYGSRYSRFLVNGTTCGIEAAILSSVKEGEKILLPRNAHRSVCSGLVMSGAVPVWIPPVTEECFGFPSSVSPEAIREKFDKDQEIRACLIVSPSYYGSFCDIRGIAKICHSHRIPLIVDEAHGAHLYFTDLRKFCAIECGADLSVMSAHKTLSAFGQSSWLHLCSAYIAIEDIDRALKMLMSSSPSYMLMASLDSARREAVLYGREYFEKAAGIAERIRKGAANAGYAVYEAAAYDPTRVVLSASAAGLSGNELSDRLFEEHAIAVEMADRENIVLVVTAANTPEDARRLITALEELAVYHCRTEENGAGPRLFERIPEVVMTPREAYFAPKKQIRLQDAAGRTAGEEVVVYPPGSAIIYPGERIDEQILETIGNCKASGLTLQKGSGSGADELTVI